MRIRQQKVENRRTKNVIHFCRISTRLATIIIGPQISSSSLIIPYIAHGLYLSCVWTLFWVLCFQALVTDVLPSQKEIFQQNQTIHKIVVSYVYLYVLVWKAGKLFYLNNNKHFLLFFEIILSWPTLYLSRLTRCSCLKFNQNPLL
jgi:hypothetical protein